MATTPGTAQEARRDLILVADPLRRSTPAIVLAAWRAGALGVLDTSTGPPAETIEALTGLRTRGVEELALRVPLPRADELANALDGAGLARIVVDARAVAPASADAAGLAEAVGALAPVAASVHVEVTAHEVGTAALAAGAAGLIGVGCESGGRIGDTESSILLQQLVALAEGTDAGVWIAGGIGLHTAPAALAGGARGVVLDAQLALVREAGLPDTTAAAVAAMDGSETRVLGGHRLYTRPDLEVAALDDSIGEDEVRGRLGPDLHADLVPLGADGALAAAFSRRFGTVGGVVAGLRASIAGHLAAARQHQPLAPGHGVSATHGTAYPIAQGPMTRVSDRAAFALSVAEAGGLPFLALALMTGAEVRALLTETAELLGDRPWGVGILGFVPPEVRDAQLEVVHDVAPPLALIAGGRPSQAKPLEDAGITTYLHVPSPGLLDRFVRDGARRFIFEGRECGGHVGPRSSFSLWEAQVERLLEVDDPESLHLLFAGGIHDGRSAAMAATAAAPLAARGAKVGVLMGTAYLFTPEAVAGGAITPTFQQIALDCTRTVLLETAPGHATRCVETDYVRAFAARRDELVADGVEAQARWAELETLNLGRLRMASKGITRDGGELVELDEEAQRRDGMFMIGEVATLRDEAVPMAELHRQVSEGSVDALEATAARGHLAVLHEPPSAPAPLEVAVVGMASIFPGSSDTDRFWTNIVTGVNSIREVPSERWDVDLYYDPEAVTRDAGRKTPSRWGGFLDAVAFDPLAYGIPPASLAAIEPVQLLSLEVAARALADAGYATREFDRARASVVFGAESGNDLAGAYGFRAYFPQLFGALPPELEEHLPAYTEDSFPGVLTNVIAGRIANRLDLGGINYTLDAACASSLAAVDAACKELVAGTSDLVVCGGADLHNGLNDYLLFASVHALSPTGQCRTFDAAADGIALGEGIAAVILKRRADAERDGDRVYAVIDAVAGSSDGRHLGLTAPRKEGQQRAVVRALAQAGRPAAEIGLVEAHGTGTVVGDRTELATLTELYAEGGAEPGSVVVGSVKSQIGHTKCAAGLAGLIKAVRAVHHGVLPPTLNVVDPNPYWDPATSPFRLLDRARPWLADERRAAVSAFGFGGTNFHAIVSAADAEVAPHGLHDWPAELVLVRAEDAAAGSARLGELADAVDAIVATDPDGQRHHLRDLARTLSASGTGPVQAALVAEDLADLADRLRAAAEGRAGEGTFLAAEGADVAGGQVAFLYPGQGSQRPGMLGELFVTFPALRDILTTGAEWAEIMLPPAAFGREARAAQQAALTATDVAQPTLGMAALAVTRLLASTGVRPDLAGGHSYGELAALAAAGAFDDATLLRLSQARGAAITAAVDASGGDAGAMAAVRLTRDELDERLAAWPELVVANHNGPTQVVLSGPSAAVESAVEDLTAAGVKAKRLPVACAFHSPLVASASHDLATALAAVEVGELAFPIWSNVTAEPYRDASEVPDLLARQVAEGVRFVEQVEAMYAAGARTFVEAGPGRVLTQQVADILGDRPHRVVATDVAGEPGLTRLLLALAELAALGVPVDPTALFEGRAERVELRSLPRPRPGWTVDGMLTRTADGQPVAGGLQPADSTPQLSLGALGGGASVGAGAGAEVAVLEYLRSVREIVAAERDVMLGYLGAPVTGGPVLPTTAVELPVGAALGTGASAAPTSAPAAPSGPIVPSGEALLAVVLDLVSDRTGYPVEMLDADLDLEADLSIDSIKRIEIIGELAETIGLGSAADAIDESVVEDLAAIKSLRGIVEWIDAFTAEARATAATGSGPGSGGATGSASGAAVPRGEALLAVVLDLVSDRTGYPIEMLDADLDLEADLSIDSIKRIEIIGELAETIGLGSAEDAIDESVVEDLAAIKSLRGIVEWIDAFTAGGEDPTEPEAAPDTVAAEDDGPAPAVPAHARRHVVEAIEIGPVRSRTGLSGQRVVLTVPADGDPDDRGPATLAGLLEGGLEAAGAKVELLAVPAGALDADSEAILRGADVVVHLGDTAHGADARDAFPAVAAAALGDARRLVGFCLAGAASGLPGLLKAVSREVPDTTVRSVEIDPDSWPADPHPVVDALVDEVRDADGPVEVTWRGLHRFAPSVVATDAPEPAGDGGSLALDDGAVVLVTGGARGITATVAEALARASGCHLVLVGSSPEPGPEDPRLAGAAGAPELRKALVDIGEHTSLADIEAALRRITADRQIRATLEGLAASGIEVEYRSVDVRDVESLRGLVDDVVARHGRLDGIVHGAGVLDDRFLRDKTPEGFGRVFSTKVDPARALLSHCHQTTRFVVLFGSISGVFGNRGQVDYGAANDALDKLAQVSTGPGCRVLSVDWGPWAGGGMVSPELEREYGRRGIGLVEPDEAVELLLAELRSAPGPAQIVVMRSTPDALDPDGTVIVPPTPLEL